MILVKVVFQLTQTPMVGAVFAPGFETFVMGCFMGAFGRTMFAAMFGVIAFVPIYGVVIVSRCWHDRGCDRDHGEE